MSDEKNDTGKGKARQPAGERPERPGETETVPIEQQRGELGAIGPYRLRQVLGQGGFGVVYLAAQDKPVRRQVALKVLSLDMDDRNVAARFEAEQQAMAMMSHPNIAQVFDSGFTPQGQPYFVMEYVPGIPITAFCDKHRLSTRERLELFMAVCGGVQHAHQKGIIHRDIKPSNILVALYDDKPIPKIIDFGIAKALGGELTDATLKTQYGVTLGTPAYMSPEQTEVSSLALDTRSDIYSLGVMLYELLVGARPFETRDLPENAFYDLIRRIREEEPTRPSEKLRSLDDTARDLASLRGGSEGDLLRELRGDLDWIVMKALEKQPHRRYQTASEFAGDIMRYLDSLPVSAGPPGALYKLGKFVRRHRAGVAAGVVAALALLLGLAGLTIGLVQSLTSESRAVRERTRAEREAAKAGAVNEFLQEMLASPDPGVEGRDVKVIDILDTAAGKLDAALAGQPETRAYLRQTLGNTYRVLGEVAKAKPLLEAALAEQLELLGPDHPDTLKSMNGMAIIHFLENDFAEAESLYREALERRRRVLGPDHPDTLGVMSNLALVLQNMGRLEEAESLYRDTIEAQARVLGPEHTDTLGAMGNLANVLRDEGKYADAETLLRETLQKKQRALGADHPSTIGTASNLARLAALEGRHDEAIALLRRVLEQKNRVFGPYHPGTIGTTINLADELHAVGELDEAESLHRRAVEMVEQAFGAGSPAALASKSGLAVVLFDTEKYAEAEALFREVRAARSEMLGPEHPDTLEARENEISCLYMQGNRWGELETQAAALLETQLLVRGGDHPRIAETLGILAEALFHLGKYDAAEARLRQALDLNTKLHGGAHKSTLDIMAKLAETLEKLGRNEEARELRRRIESAEEDGGGTTRQ